MAAAGARELHNRLLGTFDGKELQTWRGRLERVSLATKQVLYEPNSPIDYVYFPTGAMASLVAVMQDGTAVETAAVGHEGMVGAPLVLGATSTPLKAFCQVPGPAERLPAEVLMRLVDRSPRLRRLLNRYVQVLMVQLAQGVACNRLHSVEQRCPRWLLATRDRVATDSFPLTQEFMAEMLGVRRAGVTEVAGRLQKAGLIRYNHGRVTLLDRDRLRSAACECYSVIAEQFEQLFSAI